jgi:hypothetical protein
MCYAYWQAERQVFKTFWSLLEVNISLGSFMQLACHVKYYMAIKELITRARYPAVSRRKVNSRYEIRPIEGLQTSISKSLRENWREKSLGINVYLYLKCAFLTRENLSASATINQVLAPDT